MQRKLLVTGDGSHTILIPDLGVTYHSMHGALQESRHVFIRTGLRYALLNFPRQGILVLEIGFGTGLNALLTLEASLAGAFVVYYCGLEPYPLAGAEVAALNYPEVMGNQGMMTVFLDLHQRQWNHDEHITPNFTLHKTNTVVADCVLPTGFHLIYFDAFAPDAQPELWTKEIFEKMYECLTSGGFLVTYCSKGVVRRNMESVGFIVSKVPGPPGKWEIVRAQKP